MHTCNLEDLRRLALLAKGFSFLPHKAIQNILAGQHTSRLKGRGLDFDEARIYVPGDDVRHIDWKLSARAGQVYSKTFTEERERPVYILVDLRQRMFFGSAKTFKSVLATQLAALAAWRTFQVGDRIGAVVIGTETVKLLPPRRAQKSVLQLCQLLADACEDLVRKAQESTANPSFNQALDVLIKEMKHDGLLIAISDFSDWDVKCHSKFLKLKEHNEVILARISDPLEDALPKSSTIMTFMGEYLLQRPNDNKRYQVLRGKTFKALEEFCLSYRFPLLHFKTSKDALSQLQSYLGRGVQLKPTQS